MVWEIGRRFQGWGLGSKRASLAELPCSAGSTSLCDGARLHFSPSLAGLGNPRHHPPTPPEAARPPPTHHDPLSLPYSTPRPSKVDALIEQLPATNANVLRLLLEVCHYANVNSADTEMDSLVRGRRACLFVGVCVCVCVLSV